MIAHCKFCGLPDSYGAISRDQRRRRVNTIGIVLLIVMVTFVAGFTSGVEHAERAVRNAEPRPTGSEFRNPAKVHSEAQPAQRQPDQGGANVKTPSQQAAKSNVGAEAGQRSAHGPSDGWKRLQRHAIPEMQRLSPDDYKSLVENNFADYKLQGRLARI